VREREGEGQKENAAGSACGACSVAMGKKIKIFGSLGGQLVYFFFLAVLRLLKGVFHSDTAGLVSLCVPAVLP